MSDVVWLLFGIGASLTLGFVATLQHWRRQAKALTDREARLRLLTDALPLLISYVDRELKYRFTNAAYEKWFGKSRSEILGKSMRDVLGAEAVDSLEPYVKRVLSGETVKFESTTPYATGTCMVAATYVPDVDALKTVRGFYVLVEDISDRKRAEDALKRSERGLEAKVREHNAQLAERESQLELALGSSSTGAWQWNMADGRLTWDARMHQIFGTSPDTFEATYEAFLSRVVPEDRVRIARNVAKAVEADADFEEEYKVAWPDGSTRVVHSRGRSRRDGTNKMHGVCWDVTASRKAEEEALSNVRRFRTVFESAPDGMLIIDTVGRIDCANHQAEKIFGYRPGELKNRLVEDLVPIEKRTHHAALRQAYMQNPGVRLMGSPLDLMGCRKDGTLFPVAISLSPGPSSDGGRFIVVAFRDITLRKEAEEQARKELAEQITLSNDRLQQFTSIASHDLRAPARLVGQFLSLLGRDYAESLDDRGREYLGLAVSEAKKLQAMVDDLLEYTKVSYIGFEAKPVSLVKVMRDTLAMLSPEIDEKRADVAFEMLPTIYGSESQLRRLFVNLLSNAMKYSRKRPKIRVTASGTAEEYIVSFSDNGIGIEQEERERIFEVFFRGRGRSEASGTGIGLSSCKKVVENHRGRIWVTSEPGVGSTFHVAFPKRWKPDAPDVSSPVRADRERIDENALLH